MDGLSLIERCKFFDTYSTYSKSLYIGDTGLTYKILELLFAVCDHSHPKKQFAEVSTVLCITIICHSVVEVLHWSVTGVLGTVYPNLYLTISNSLIIGLSIERPILDHHPKAHIHEIRQISPWNPWNPGDFRWNPGDFRWNPADFMKSSGFHP